MKITKAAIADASEAVTEKELSEINKFTRRRLLADEVYTFSVLLCDNEVDRDYERFTTAALTMLMELFVGKTGVFDHQWSASEQKARIYRTELIHDKHKKNSLGEQYTYLKAYAYMLRTERNAELISEIEGGIKKEASIGCSVARGICSICGEDIERCTHAKGKIYGDALCFAELAEPLDAYEWSFVAVPAQKNAGVIKKFEGGKTDLNLKEYVKKSGDGSYLEQLEALENDAEMGRRYLRELRSEVVRLGMLSDDEFEAGTLKSAVGKMGENELMSFKRAFEGRIQEFFPPVTQLGGFKESAVKAADEEFLI